MKTTLGRCSPLAFLVLAACAASQRSAVLAEVAPEVVGLSSTRLERLDTVVERLIDDQAIAGAVVLLARRGEIAHFEAYGHLDVARGEPMRRDALFRICSMSKPVTSVAVMLLFEEGRFLLDDPVVRFLPEFAQPRVLPADGKGEPVPANAPITIRHLLTHTSGIAYRFIAPPAIAERYAAAGVTDGLTEVDFDLAENVRRIAAQPLVHQPGERFTYGLNTDVLGRLVEVVTGQSFGRFLRERVFAPLGMHDTGFLVDDARRARLATVYRADRGELEALPDGPTVEGQLVFSPSYSYAGPRASRYESGGAGLVTTAADYARFCAMIAGGGELGGVRLLSRKTVELMSADHLVKLEPSPGMAFGLGFSIAEDPGRSGEIASAGTLGWAGFYTTRFWIDPKEELIGLVLTQTYPFDSGRAMDRVYAAAYQAIAD
jgi:CubicO group peptidase (beta-lactamase class C family)